MGSSNIPKMLTAYRQTMRMSPHFQNILYQQHGRVLTSHMGRHLSAGMHTPALRAEQDKVLKQPGGEYIESMSDDLQQHAKRARPPTDFYSTHNISKRPPNSDSIFWRMWEASQDLAEMCLETDFIQGIKKGNLSPVHFGVYTVMDAYYCFNGAEDYLEASRRSSDETLKAFLKHKYLRYRRYNKTWTKKWGLKDAASIVPNKAVRRYSLFERMVCQRENPIYALVVMLPCEYLWVWLVTQIKDHNKDNLYKFWFEANSNAEGAFAMGNFIEMFRQKYPSVLDERKAFGLYRQAMQGEYADFAARVVESEP